MSKTIEGVPESLTRDQYLSIFRAVGLTPEQIVEIQFSYAGVTATVFEFGADGQKMIDGDDYAKHEIFIPVIG